LEPMSIRCSPIEGKGAYMVGSKCFNGILGFAVLAAASVAFASFAADPLDPPELEPVRIAPAPAEEQRVWLQQTGPATGKTVDLEIRIAGEQNAQEPVDFVVELKATDIISTAFLELAVTDSEGSLLHQDHTLVYIAETFTPYTLAWDASQVPSGVYKAEFTVAKPPALPVVTRSCLIKKMSRDQLLNMADQARQKLAVTLEAVEKLQEAGKKPPYIIARAAIAQDCAAFISDTLFDTPWRTSERLIRYVDSTAGALQAQIAFLNELPEFNEPITEPDLDNVTFKNGALYAGTRPAFLFGKNFGSARPEAELTHMRSYGLNLAALSLAPKNTLAGEDELADFQKEFSPVIEQAQKNNIGLFVNLDPCNLPQWALQMHPELLDPVLERVNIANPEARRIIEQHFRAAIPWLAQFDNVAALAILQNPQFRFIGEDVRQGFIAYVTEIYEDRNVLNQAWRALFSSTDEIATGWDRDDPRFLRSERYIVKPAYQYDWQIYHQRLGTQYMQGLANFARSLAEGKPLFAAFDGDILEQGEAQFGLDREAVAATFDLIGCCAANTVDDPFYALGYPQQPLVYNLLHSLAPNKPLINFCDGLIPPYDPEKPCTFDYVHAAVWEAAMAGLNASALTIDNWLAVPECLDGYVTAGLDLNRLAEIVYAFQAEPAKVAIVWSMSSKIYNEGQPFLQSVKFAYEGCSFAGYKVRFISEDQILDGELDNINVLVLPHTPSVKNETFSFIKTYIENDGALVRTSNPILFDEHGGSRKDVITTTPRTVLLRGQNLPTEYLHSMDAVISCGTLPAIPRAVNPYGYPLEGVRTRYIEHNRAAYIYAVNLRKTPIECHIFGGPMAGRDLIQGRDVTFPTVLQPLKPMLVKLNEIPNVAPPTALVTPPEVPPQS